MGMSDMRIEICERRTANGYLELSTMLSGRRVHQLYIGYTKREARRLFRRWLREECK